MDRGFVVWLTGLPGSGKTTIARGVAERIKGMGYHVEVLDGDWVRKTINPDAGFDREGRSRRTCSLGRRRAVGGSGRGSWASCPTR